MHETISSAHMQEEKVRLLVEQSSSFYHLQILGMLAVFGSTVWTQFSPSVIVWLVGSTTILWFLHAQRRRQGSSKSVPSEAESLSLRLRQTVFVAGAFWGLLPVTIGTHSLHSLTFPLIAILVMASAVSLVFRQTAERVRAFLFGLATSTTISLATLIGIQTLPVIALILVAAALLDTHARRFGELQSKALKLRTETRRLRQELTIARDSLETQRQLDLQEERIARHVFKQLTLTSDQGLPGIWTWNEPMGKLSGDLIQVARGPDSGIYLFLGDFTGHGLPAALGAVPASTIFRTMVHKGLAVSSIAGELNKKLHTLLPTGYFCCAAIMKLSPDRRRFTLWDGGLPPILIRRSDSGSVEEIHGGHLPLGVLDETEFSSNCSTWELEEADRVLVYSDGLTETQDLNGDSWGKDRLIHCLTDTAGNHLVIERLKAEILEFTHFAPPSDDLSIIEIVAGESCQNRKVA